jgi:hypothetical protein
MNRSILGLAWLFMLGQTLYSQSSHIPSFGKGILDFTAPDSSWSLKLGARIQLLSDQEWTVNSTGNFTNSTSNFQIRRSRLKLDGFAYSPKLEYKIEFGLSNRDMSGVSAFTSSSPRYIMDAVVKWNFFENFVLWIGQTKLPGNVERVISSGNLQLVDRSILNSRFNIDRDIGLQLRHETNLSSDFLIREILAFSQGEGRNVTTGNLGGHEFTARMELLPFGAFSKDGEYSGGDLVREPKPKFMLASSYDYNNNAVRTRGNQGSYMTTTNGFYQTPISTLFVDAVFKYSGFSVMAEYANRNAENPIAINSDGTITGQFVEVGKALNMQTGYLFKTNWELAGRLTHVDWDRQITGRGKQNQYTLGLSRYLVGHKLKLQTDLSYLSNELNSNEFLWRLQMDLHF